MKKRYKILLEIVAFILMLTACLGCCYNAVRYKDKANGGGMENFYYIDTDVDLLFFGSSHTGCTINNGIIWDKCGISNYSLWVASQKGDGTYYYMKEAFKYVKPKVAVVETLNLIDNTSLLEDIYLSGLTTKWSLDYIKYVHDLVSVNDFTREFTEELFFRMPIVHSRYRELNRYDFLNTDSYNRGYSGRNEVIPVPAPVLTEEREELSAHSKEQIQNIIDLCEENNVELVFFNAPYSASEDDIKIQNSIRDYVTERGYEYLAFNHEYEKYGINFDTDMRETSHLNDYGAEKVTNAILDYLTDNYTFENHKGDPEYIDWDKHLEFLNNKKDIYLLGECNNIQDYVNILGSFKDKYTIIVSFNGDYKAYETYADKPDLSALGINEETYDKGGIVLIQNGDIKYYSGESKEYTYYTELSGGIDCNIYKSEPDEFNHINLYYYDLTPEYNGFSIVVYSEDSYKIMDYMCVDVYAGSDVIHPEYE